MTEFIDAHDPERGVLAFLKQQQEDETTASEVEALNKAVENSKAARGVASVQSQELSRWADRAMYAAEPMPESPTGGPTVTLLGATPDPLGTLAAFCGMYEGRVVRDYREITDEQRREALDNMLATSLQGPLETIRFHFLIENVSRSWTHQAVRTRSAFFAQESLRFAVKEDWTQEIPIPLSVAANEEGPGLWEFAMDTIEDSYMRMIDAGVPAEEARGLLPSAIRTRLHVSLDYRTLLHLAGLRLCTQAEFEWRAVMAGIVNAMREHLTAQGELGNNWQFRALAERLKPICYQTGRCGFMAKFDRGCTIRDRVEANARAGRPSSEWGESYAGAGLMDFEGEDAGGIPAIRPEEWAADPTAARRG